MTMPFQLLQKDVTLTAAAAEDIRARADRLNRFHGRIMRCRVTVEGSGNHHRQGKYGVRIDLTIPGAEVLVRKHASANLELALKGAFSTAARRLEDHLRKARGFVKSHEGR